MMACRPSTMYSRNYFLSDGNELVASIYHVPAEPLSDKALDGSESPSVVEAEYLCHFLDGKSAFRVFVVVGDSAEDVLLCPAQVFPHPYGYVPLYELPHLIFSSFSARTVCMLAREVPIFSIWDEASA